ncbi:hypothetical protein B0T21DRAFT_414350 [Apiosordaria backusii]|uniref:Uncharacterized protein n=1 Tax=Apiosordaria backusii TaxID=314023 RepID=A0AA40AXW9_9PEZI|nr:hypothetical protein B0T21DRAFT_414350 [Apiosordaria backusii]
MHTAFNTVTELDGAAELNNAAKSNNAELKNTTKSSSATVSSHATELNNATKFNNVIKLNKAAKFNKVIRFNKAGRFNRAARSSNTGKLSDAPIPNGSSTEIKADQDNVPCAFMLFADARERWTKSNPNYRALIEPIPKKTKNATERSKYDSPDTLPKVSC